MNSSRLIEDLILVLDCQRTELQTVDRVLVKAGLREKSRGQHHPEITRRYALRLLLALSGARSLVHAASDLQLIETLKPIVVQNNPDFTVIFGVGVDVDAVQQMTVSDALDIICERLVSGKIPRGYHIGVEVEVAGNVSILYRQHELLFQSARDRVDPYPNFARLTRFNEVVLRWIGENLPEVAGHPLPTSPL